MMSKGTGQFSIPISMGLTSAVFVVKDIKKSVQQEER